MGCRSGILHRVTTEGPSPKPARPARQQRAPRVTYYLESRYRKLERGLPQTIFYCPECKGDRRRVRGCKRCDGFGKLTRDSVQELIARVVLPAFKARFGKFHGAGREDIDVKMLGRGRPFVYEVVGVRNEAADLDAIDARLREVYAGRIELDPFQKVERSRVAYWKEAQLDKCYRAWIEASGPVDLERLQGLVGTSLAVTQRTPQRVAYRRADLERERWVEVLSVGEVAERSFTVDIRCMHGTYVKEWVNSDGGRTQSSLTELLGVGCECVGLDVLDILTSEGDAAPG